MKGINTIIWDWNGTLLNDTDICIDTINILLQERNLPQISRDKYLEVFGFPVIDYYKRIGFDFNKEPFEIPAHQYIETYTSKLKESALHENSEKVLQFFQRKRFKQVILSASEQQKLNDSVQLFGIEKYFEATAGLDNHFASSKTEIGKMLLQSILVNPSEACLIGDTTHDYSVAKELACSCILIANGHQAKEKLEKTGALVLNRLDDLLNVF
ncbi:MAG: HAD hydrolase-like protein [Prolixibacteraceae bacterium]|nr:HAD hydrolase-like protein [Prolixibacteraceae bacterium]